MSTTVGVKSGLHIPVWRPLAAPLTNFAVGLGLTYDMRNNEDRHPEVFQIASAAALNAYNFKTDNWIQKNPTSLALGGTLGAGNACGFAPHRGPRGSITAYATGGTPSYYKVTLGASTVPAASIVWLANQLADRGDGRGFKIRLIGNSAGGGGKISEHIITANTAGATPVVYLDTAPSFTPQNGDSYEILSGSVVVMLGGAAAANDVKAMEVASQTVSTFAQKPVASGTDSQLLCLDEMYVPYDRSPGEGLLGVMTCTGSALGSITGQTANTANVGDAGVAANEFKNFQIRIVEDVTNPQAVGQRRVITSHTSGPGPVYTINANWTYTPTSGTAKYVIEYPNIYLWQPQGQTYCAIYRDVTPYCAVGSGAWDTTTLTGRGGAAGAGVTLFPCFGAEQDNQIPATDAANRVFRYSQVHSFRGAASATLDIIDIAAQTITNTTAAGPYYSFTTGSSYAYDPASNLGMHVYVNTGQAATARYNVKTRQITPFSYIPIALGTLVVGQRMAALPFVDGTTKVTRLFMLAIGAVGFFDLVVTGY